MKKKWKIIIAVIVVAALTAAVSFAAEHQAEKKAEGRFEKTVLANYGEKLKEKGFSDLKIKTDIKKMKGKGISFTDEHIQVNPEYTSEEIDSLYKDDKVSPQLLHKMNAMRYVQNGLNRRTEYSYGPFRVSMDLDLGHSYGQNGHYRDYFQVKSSHHTYLYKNTGSLVSLSVDGQKVYQEDKAAEAALVQEKSGAAANQNCPAVRRSNAGGDTKMTEAEKARQSWPYIQWDYPDEIDEAVEKIYGTSPDPEEINPYVVESWLEHHESH